MSKPVVIVVLGNKASYAIICTSKENAQKVFLDCCQSNIGNWDEYTEEDRQVCLLECCVRFGRGSVCLVAAEDESDNDSLDNWDDDLSDK